MGQQQNECTRCGTCCAKGGPALHKEDLALMERGTFARKDLMTLRKGELVRDEVSSSLVPLEEEIVKIKGRTDNTWTCCFLNVVDRLCFVYKDRPAECRALDCWNTDKLEAMYNVDRITRADIIGSDNGLAELVAAHEEQCDYTNLREVAKNVLTDDAARNAFLEVVRFDMAFRAIVQEKAGVPKEELLFLFGRSVADTANMFGLEVTLTEHGPEVAAAKIDDSAD